MIKSIKINSWRQYQDIDIEIHPRLTIITGANGAGKTTLLNLISRHFGWPGALVGTPKKDKKTGAIKFVSDFWKKIFKDGESNTNNKNTIGTIVYDNNQKANILVPDTVGFNL